MKTRTKSQSTYAVAQLRERNLKVTKARLAILRVFGNEKDPLSAERIYEKVARAHVDKATVYRALGTLEKSGLLRSVDIGHNHGHYELATGPEHHHIICTRCGKIEEVFICVDPKTLKAALRQSHAFVTIEKHALELYSICRECRSKEQKEAK